jgi:hypothetical protein
MLVGSSGCEDPGFSGGHYVCLMGSKAIRKFLVYGQRINLSCTNGHVQYRNSGLFSTKPPNPREEICFHEQS